MAKPISGVHAIYDTYRKHLRRWAKRQFWKRHRKAGRLIRD